MLTSANDVLGVVLIVLAPLCVGWGGFSLRSGLRVAAGLGAVIVWAALWLLFGEPWSPHPVAGFYRGVLETGYFGGAVAALAGSGHKRLSTLLTILYGVNAVIRFFWS